MQLPCNAMAQVRCAWLTASEERKIPDNFGCKPCLTQTQIPDKRGCSQISAGAYAGGPKRGLTCPYIACGVLCDWPMFPNHCPEYAGEYVIGAKVCLVGSNLASAP
jgi:hypothetical protein